ncbi:hypothetical protein QR680_001332 [Steinernema hermaphroditum]|uniref:Uncharacterized protein n=1 Tax=Steinernema hermaphroditum TaxID=289476 RepID=A0AA39H0L9_9BILA|nr:hypothetical protein QR680_001332 [Steinernema hermaphroditum]
MHFAHRKTVGNDSSLPLPPVVDPFKRHFKFNIPSQAHLQEIALVRSRPDDNRILIYGNEENMHPLQVCAISVVPKLSDQHFFHCIYRYSLCVLNHAILL